MMTTGRAPIKVPEAPSELTFSNVQASSVDLSWIDNSNNEFGFIIERSEDQGKTYTKIHETTNAITTYKNTGLKAVTEYVYRISAFNSAGHSRVSNTRSVITSDVSPTAPTTLSIITKTHISIHIGWVDTGTNEQSFIVERSGFPDGNYDVIATLGANSIGYQDS